MKWLVDNKEWVFSGIGVTVGFAVVAAIWRIVTSRAGADAKHIESTVYGSNNSQVVGNNNTINMSSREKGDSNDKCAIICVSPIMPIQTTGANRGNLPVGYVRVGYKNIGTEAARDIRTVFNSNWADEIEIDPISYLMPDAPDRTVYLPAINEKRAIEMHQNSERIWFKIKLSYNDTRNQEWFSTYEADYSPESSIKWRIKEI